MAEKPNRINFTKAALEDIPPPAKLAYWYDTRTPGLMLMVTPKGYKTFYVYRKVNGRPERIKLGPWPDMPVDLARRKAAEALGRIASGENPAADRRQLRADPTFAELFTWYIETHAKPHKRSWAQDQAIYDRYLSGLGSRKASAVTRTDVRQLHTALKAKGVFTANRAIWLLRQVFNEAAGHQVIDCPNPATGIRAFREARRDRRLSIPEVGALVLALVEDEDPTARAFFLLSLMTGVRRANLQAMRWDEIDWDGGTWRIPVTKNGAPQWVPLLDFELSILRSRRKEVPGPWVFPGTGRTGHMVEPKRAWSRILQRAGLDDFRIHDLRRSLASLMVDAGASLAIVGKALNHGSPQATALYARLSLDPVREYKAKALAGVFATLRDLESEG